MPENEPAAVKPEVTEEKLSVEEIQRREAEKAALLTKLQARRPSDEVVLTDEAKDDEETPVEARSSKAILAEIERVKLARHRAQEAAEREFNEQIASLV